MTIDEVDERAGAEVGERAGESGMNPAIECPEPDLRKTGIHPDYWYPLARSKDLKQGKPLGVAFDERVGREQKLQVHFVEVQRRRSEIAVLDDHVLVRNFDVEAR